MFRIEPAKKGIYERVLAVIVAAVHLGVFIAWFGFGGRALYHAVLFGLIPLFVWFLLVIRLEDALRAIAIRRIDERSAILGAARVRALLAQVAVIGTQPSQGAWLVPDPGEAISAPNRNMAEINVPLEALSDFAWSGQTVRVSRTERGDIKAVSEPAEPLPGVAPDGLWDAGHVGGQRCLALPVPRRQTRTAKTRNTFSPSRLLAASRPLRAEIEAGYPESRPEEVLDRLLGFRDAVIGMRPDWLQQAENEKCRQCGKTMRQFCAFSEAELGGSAEGRVYVLGCGKHPQELCSVVQYS